MNLVKLWLLLIISTQISTIFKASLMPFDQQMQLDIELLSLCRERTLTESQATKIQFLLSQGANPNVRDCDFGALHYAVLHNNIHLAELLIKADANVNIKSLSDEETPLHIAIGSDNEDIIKLLLIHNANPQILNRFKRSSLDVAKKQEVRFFEPPTRLDSSNKITRLVLYYSLLNHDPKVIQNRTTLFGQIVMHAYNQFYFNDDPTFLEKILGISGNENGIPENVKMRALNFFNTEENDPSMTGVEDGIPEFLIYENPSIIRLLETKTF